MSPADIHRGSTSAVVYEVFPRAHGPGGTLAGVSADLPRIAALGAEILWVMPIHPTGEKRRKGTLGSPYAVADHLAVDPAIGDTGDLAALVEAAHARGLRVILDWVPNHVAPEHPFVTEHPEWVLGDDDGAPRPPEPEWTDVVGLDYRQAPLHDAMIAAMVHWVERAGVDGFRCDVAGSVPGPFFTAARAALEACRPGVFLLAEAEGPRHHAPGAFDATYDWTTYTRLADVRRGRLPAESLVRSLAGEADTYPHGAGRLRFVENHDTPRACARFGRPFTRAALALLMLAPGLPLVYAGLEAGATHRPSLFDPDRIRLEDDGALAPWITRLAACRRAHAALGDGPLRPLPTRRPREIAAFRRGEGGAEAICVVNLSPRSVPFEPLVPIAVAGTDALTGRRVAFDRRTALPIGPYDAFVLIVEPPAGCGGPAAGRSAAAG